MSANAQPPSEFAAAHGYLSAPEVHDPAPKHDASLERGDSKTQGDIPNPLGCELCGKHKRRRFYLTTDNKRVCGHCVGRRLGGRPT